jgi:hypothetical protein
VAQWSIALALCRPVVRTQEATAWSAPPVSSRASSIFLPADRPNSSIDSLVSLPNSDTVSVTAFKVVKMFLPRLRWTPRACFVRTSRARLLPLRSRGRQVEPPWRTCCSSENCTIGGSICTLQCASPAARLFRSKPAGGWPNACSVLDCCRFPVESAHRKVF